MLEKLKSNHKIIAVLGAALAAVFISVAVILVNTVNHGGSAKIEYSDENRNATITIGEDDVTNENSDEHGLGEVMDIVEKEDVPTVESVEADGPVVDTDAGEGVSLLDCPEGEECGLGAYIWAPVDTPSAFKNYTIGKFFNTDGAYGSQCWDLADVFWQNVTSRRAQTCGTGAAKGMIADGCWQKNAGSEFLMIWDKSQIQPGDWIIFTNGQWGHVGMALGTYNNGYVTLLGQNQGGVADPQGGSAANIINISLKNFGGAFRLRRYEEARIAAEETKKPKPVVSDTDANVGTSGTYTVRQGDTLGSISLKMGWYVSGSLFGDNGYTQKLAEKNGISDRGMIYPGQVINRY